MSEVSFPIAFIAGVFSFVSPCVLPLIPGYVSFVTGIAPDEKPKSFTETLLPLVLFVAGFTLIFTILGATSILLGYLLKTYKYLLIKFAALFIVFTGLYLMGLLRIGFLDKSNQSLLQRTKNSSSFVMGMAFALGWTPCIGIFLTPILATASQAETALRGSSLLLTYSLGLGLPLILTGQIFAVSKYRFDWLKKNSSIINKIGGFLLVIMGLLLFFNKLELITINLQKLFPAGWQFF